MIEITEDDLKKKEDHYIELAEKGEPILVTKPDGNKYLMFLKNQMISNIYGIMTMVHK